MIWAEHFLETNNHLSININHCNWGSFEELLHSQDQTPHNRLYFISSDSPCANSYICNHADNSKRYSLEAGTIFFIPGHYDLEYAFYPELVFTAIHFRLELFTGFDIFSDQELPLIAIEHKYYDLDRKEGGYFYWDTRYYGNYHRYGILEFASKYHPGLVNYFIDQERFQEDEKDSFYADPQHNPNQIEENTVKNNIIKNDEKCQIT